MFMPPPQHPDEHLMRTRAERKEQDARGSQDSRTISAGARVILTVFVFAAVVVIALVVFALI